MFLGESFFSDYSENQAGWVLVHWSSESPCETCSVTLHGVVSTSRKGAFINLQSLSTLQGR